MATAEYSELAFKLAQLRIEAQCNGWLEDLTGLEDRIITLADAVIHTLTR